MSRFYHASLLFTFLLFLGLTACDDDELKAPIPGYLTIEDVVLQTTSSNQGSDNDNITDINVFIDNQSLGTFELPASIPIQKSGRVNLKIRAVIQNSGRSNERVNYPFYTTFEIDTTFERESEMKLTPLVYYSENVVFTDNWSGEDFETGINFNYSSKSDTILVRITGNEAFENASGLAYLSSNSTFFEAISPSFFNIPRDGTPVYMELNYKSTHDIATGIYVNNESVQIPASFFRARASWTKVYIDLSNTIAQNSGAGNYSLFIGYQKNIGEIGKLYLDNVKLLHF